jgi:Cysteine rich repeat
MINTLGRAAMLGASLVIVNLAVATSAFSQTPTDAQRSAIRAQCRSDYEAHCASVPPGGMASLQCLQQNMSSLSSGCQTAVRAVETPAAPKAETAPAAAPKETAPPAKPAAETVAPAAPKETAKETAKETSKEPSKAATSTTTKKPSSSQIAALRSACRSDYQKVCAGVPTGGAPALQCLEKNKSGVSAACQQAVDAASGGTTPAAAGAPSDAETARPGTAATPPPSVLVLRPMRPREILFVLRSACGGDVRTLCAGVPPGGGRIIECLATQAVSLSPACTDVLSQFPAQ